MNKMHSYSLENAQSSSRPTLLNFLSTRSPPIRAGQPASPPCTHWLGSVLALLSPQQLCAVRSNSLALTKIDHVGPRKLPSIWSQDREICCSSPILWAWLGWAGHAPVPEEVIL